MFLEKCFLNVVDSREDLASSKTNRPAPSAAQRRPKEGSSCAITESTGQPLLGRYKTVVLRESDHEGIALA